MVRTNRRTVLRSGAAIAATGVLGSIAGCSSILGGGGPSGDLSYGDSVEDELSEDDEEDTEYNGYYDEYTFGGSEGDEVVVTMTSPQGDTLLMLEDPDGEQVAENDDIDFASGNYNSEIEHELESSGLYTIIATSFSSSATFEYELELEKQ